MQIQSLSSVFGETINSVQVPIFAAALADYQAILWIALGLLVVFLAVCGAGLFAPWVRALFAGAHISLWRIVCMTVRRVPVNAIVGAYITAVKATLPVGLDELEAHHLAGGNIINSVKALVVAERAGLQLPWDKACAIDLATRTSGKTVLDAVYAALNPKIVEWQGDVSGVAKDGVQLKVQVRVTVRTALESFIKGAREETVIARVSEAVTAAIGNAENYREVLESPVKITKKLLGQGLNEGTALDVVSIDITSVEVGENVAARLAEAQAKAEQNAAQAQAEVRRTVALAAEQEMKAKTQRMRSLLIEAEVQVPLALAEALRAGRLGVVDYHRLENLKADTQMRLKLGLPDEARI